jgi:hypothetical protein
MNGEEIGAEKIRTAEEEIGTAEEEIGTAEEEIGTAEEEIGTAEGPTLPQLEAHLCGHSEYSRARLCPQIAW